MARTTFGRTIVVTHCDVRYVDENNTIERTEIDLLGDYDMQTAQNAAKKKLNAKGAIVESISHSSYYGFMDIETFAEHCNKKNFKDW